MASHIENVSGIRMLGDRATRAMNSSGMADLRAIKPNGSNADVPVMIDNTNLSASKARERKALVNAVQSRMPKSQINLNYDITDDIDALDEERRYRAAATFLEWLVNSYDGDAFSLHVMFEKHPIFLEMLQKSIRYWADAVTKFNTAKLLPRTMWDQDIEDTVFMIYTMSPTEKDKYFHFISSNPFINDGYDKKPLVQRGPFSPRKVLNGYDRNDAASKNGNSFIRAMGGAPIYKDIAVQGYKSKSNMPTKLFDSIFPVRNEAEDASVAL
jgi:hypothetical protein